MNYKETIEFVKSVFFNKGKTEVFISIVDNSCNAEEYKNLSKGIQDLKFENIYIFKAEGNIGYLNGLLLGTYSFKEKIGSLPEWVFFSNTDIFFESKNFFEQFLLKKYEKQISLVGVSIYSDLQKTYQNPMYLKRLSKDKIERIIFINKNKILKIFYQILSLIKNKITNNKEQKSKFVYAVHGSFMALKSELFNKKEKVGYFSHLYGEENFISELVLRESKKIYYDSTLKIIHKEHSTTGKILSVKKNKMIVDSLEKILKEFYK